MSIIMQQYRMLLFLLINESIKIKISNDSKTLKKLKSSLAYSSFQTLNFRENISFSESRSEYKLHTLIVTD